MELREEKLNMQNLYTWEEKPFDLIDVFLKSR